MGNVNVSKRHNNIPNWASESDTADIHPMTARLEAELRHAAHLQPMDLRLGDKLRSGQHVVLPVSLSTLKVTAQQVLSEVAQDAAPRGHSEPDG